MTTVQEGLFPLDSIPYRELNEAESVKIYGHSLFETLNTSLDGPSLFKYVRIELKPNAAELRDGNDFTSKLPLDSVSYDNEEDFDCEWAKYGYRTDPLEAFLINFGATSDGEVIVHLMGHITDAVSLTAVLLKDIDRLYLYSDNAKNVMAAYQNAEVDGVARWLNDESSEYIDFVVLERFKDKYWPEPELVYSAS